MIRRWLRFADGSEPTPLKRYLFRTALLLAALGVGGFLVAASGIIPIKASSGHWAITAWFLNFTMNRSVATHTLGLKTPELDVPTLVVKGAGHYEAGCRPCHGSPGLPPPRIALRMTPPPPLLPPLISKREPRELFYVVKHGIKFTGMPAWPTPQRDDEVWAVVAFLRKLPELDAASYRKLVSDEAVPLERAPLEELLVPNTVAGIVSASCARCHGVDGLGRGLGAFPRLAGQKFTYLHASLQAYARAERHSGIMEPIAAGLTSETMRDLARYYANLPDVGRRPLATNLFQPAGNTPAIERGKAIASAGIPGQRVPACVACHGPSPTRHNPIFPVLAGQYADYLILQLEIFGQEHRGGTEYSHLMHFVTGGLTAEQRHEVALYYASLTWTRDPSPP